MLAVLWRSKRLLLGGVLLGAALAILSYGRPGLSHGAPSLTPRAADEWQSEAQLLITQTGFPYGRAGYEHVGTLASLSPVYATFANGSTVQAAIRQRGEQLGISGSVQASEAWNVATSVGLPFVNLTATAPTQTGAVQLVSGAASILQAYVAAQQQAARIPPAARIQLPIVKAGVGTKLVKGPKLSVPILVFMAVLIAVASIAVLKARLRPSVDVGAERVPFDLESQRPYADVAAPARHERTIHERTGMNGGETGVHRQPVAVRRDH